LGNTLQSRPPVLDELVPSRYALRVGETDMLVISDGVVTPPAESMATNADPAIRGAWLDDMFLARDVFDWALTAVVVCTGGRTILIDSGLGEQYPDFPRAGNLVHRLEAAGIDLASVTDVVLTHMHFDHIGGLLVDGVKGRLRPRGSPPRVNWTDPCQGWTDPCQGLTAYCQLFRRPLSARRLLSRGAARASVRRGSIAVQLHLLRLERGFLHDLHDIAPRPRHIRKAVVAFAG